MPFFILLIKGKGKKFKGEFMQKQVKKFLGVIALLFAITACSTNSGEKKEAKEEVKTESKEEVKNHPKDELVLGIGSEPEKGFNPIFES